MQILGPLLMTILALGDSVTVGPLKPPVRRGRRPPPVTAAPSYIQIVGRQLGEPAINAGVAGDTSKGMLARLDTSVLARRPRVVLVMTGLNDAARVDPGPKPRNDPRVSEADFEKNLTAIVERLRKAKAVPVLVTPNPMTRAYKYQNLPFYQENDINDGLTPYVDVTRRVARVTGVCLADVFGDWVGRPELRALVPDGLHPNAEGHRRIAGKVMEACGAVLKPRAAPRP